MNSIPLRTPAQMLEDETVLTMTQLAWVTGGLFVKGKNKGAPDRRRGIELVKSGAVTLIDQTQPEHRWMVWTGEARRFLAEGPRKSQLRRVAS